MDEADGKIEKTLMMSNAEVDSMLEKKIIRASGVLEDIKDRIRYNIRGSESGVMKSVLEYAEGKSYDDIVTAIIHAAIHEKFVELIRDSNEDFSVIEDALAIAGSILENPNKTFYKRERG